MPLKHLSQIFVKSFSLIVMASLLMTGNYWPSSLGELQAAGIPQLIYPANGQTTTSTTDPPLGLPSLTWKTVPGAIIYRLQVSNESDFTPPDALDITTHNTSFTPQSIQSLLADGEWFWRVRVEQPIPIGDWSATYHFSKSWASAENKPELIAPADGQTLAFFDQPAFSWMPVQGAARYRFQIAATSDGFNEPLLSSETLATAYQPSVRLPNQVYFWRVIPLDASEHLGTASITRSFIAAYGQQYQEMVPALISPQDEDQPTFTPTFRWTAVVGAEHYRLEYTADPACDFNSATAIDTRQTIYTPTKSFPNSIRYCWRVRVESGEAVGDWSQVWHFARRWDLKPELLTPTNFYQSVLYPVYSWTPVAGAASYLVQISGDPTFGSIYEEAITANTTFTPQVKYDGNYHYFWRVTPIDGDGNAGESSNVSDFVSIYTSIAPIQIYPLYYDTPNQEADNGLNPYENRAVAYPVFMWHRIINPHYGGLVANAYRIDVASSPYFEEILWQYDTENTSASPTEANDFNPLPEQVYYWRVCPLSQMGSACLQSQGVEMWSQVWAARFNPQMALTPTAGDSPELLRPMIGQELVEATPLLEWRPYEGATEYQVEASRDKDFSTSEFSTTVNIPIYSPRYALAQRNLELIKYGTYYWRVRGYTSEGWSAWSDPWRFQIAAQSDWRSYRAPGSSLNKHLIGEDPAGDIPDVTYDLTTLYGAQSAEKWFFGFDIDISPITTTYVVYLDLDNIEGSGATFPPQRNYQATTVPEHQPEYAIYIDVLDGTISPQHTWIFAWDGSTWDFGHNFSEINASIHEYGDYVELEIPNAGIGMNENTSSASIILYSVDSSSGLLQDSVPSDPDVPGGAILSRFSALSEHMNLVYPPVNTAGNLESFPSLLPFYWDWPVGVSGSTPFAGFNLQVDLDQNYSPPHEADFENSTNTTYFSQNSASFLDDLLGDRTYYWRIQPRYMAEGFPPAMGSWTGGWSIQRSGFKPQNLTTSASLSTPTFNWDMAEGARSYRLQVAPDPEFLNPIIDIDTPMNTYTPLSSLATGTYYWRVKLIRYGDIENEWSDIQEFDSSLPVPTGLSPDTNPIIAAAPSLCWTPLVEYSGEIPILAAWKYYLQVSPDLDFNVLYDVSYTYHNCWTPTKGYANGAYYWRVAMIDGNNHSGPYSPPATFQIQAPITSLASPLGGVLTSTPIFRWSSVDRAASYHIEVSWYQTFAPIYDAQLTTGIQYTPTSVYDNNRVYYWRVAVLDYEGNRSEFTNPASFEMGVVYRAYLPQVKH